MTSLSPGKPRRGWLIPAIIAAVIFLGGAATEILGDDLREILRPYSKWVWAAFALAFIAAIVVAIKESRKDKDDPPSNDDSSKGERNVSARDIENSTIISGDGTRIEQHFHQSETATISPPHQIRTPPKYFTGREEELRDLLSQFDKGRTLFGIYGLSGMGKTELARKLAEELKPFYTDGQIFLDLKGITEQKTPLTAAQAMLDVIRAYEPGYGQPDSDNELQGKYLTVLSEKKVLLLMDNAAGPDQVKPLLPPASCALIVTSRLHFHLPDIYPKDINKMIPDDARKLLLKVAPHIEDHADEIAKLCGYMPLALCVTASALVVRRNLSPAEYVRRLNDEKQRLHYLKEVDIALSVSYEMLDEEKQKLWRALAVFPDTFDDNAVASVWEMRTDEATDTLSELYSYSFVEYDEEARRYGLHDLTRLFAKARLGEEEREALKRRHAAHYQLVLAQAGRHYLQEDNAVKLGLKLFDLERGNIEAGWAWAASKTEVNDRAAQLCIKYPYAGLLILKLRQHPRERIRWLEVALAAARRLKDRDAEGVALGNLGSAYDEAGNPRKAIELYEQALAITREMGNRRDEGAVLGNIGLAYLALGDAHKAIEYIKQHLAIAQEVGDRQSEANALCNMGRAYAELDDPRKAIEYYEQSLPVQRETGNLRFEGTVLRNIGKAYSELGETDKAIEPYEQALRIYREIEDRLGESDALSHLGMAYVALRKGQEAIGYLDQCLAIAREASDREGEGGALCNIGRAYAGLNEMQKAVECYKQSLVINRKTGNRRFEANVLINLGNAYTALDERREAIESYEQALVIYREMGDKRRESYVLWGLGFAYHKFKEPHKALEFYEQYLTMTRESGYRRSEGQALNLMGSAYTALNEPLKAIESYEQSIAIARETNDRWGEGNALWNMSLALDTLGEGEHERAVEYAEAALKVKEEIGDSCAEKVRNKLAEWRQS